MLRTIRPQSCNSCTSARVACNSVKPGRTSCVRCATIRSKPCSFTASFRLFVAAKSDVTPEEYRRIFDMLTPTGLVLLTKPEVEDARARGIEVPNKKKRKGKNKRQFPKPPQDQTLTGPKRPRLDMYPSPPLKTSTGRNANSANPAVSSPLHDAPGSIKRRLMALKRDADHGAGESAVVDEQSVESLKFQLGLEREKRRKRVDSLKEQNKELNVKLRESDKKFSDLVMEIADRKRSDLQGADNQTSDAAGSDGVRARASLEVAITRADELTVKLDEVCKERDRLEEERDAAENERNDLRTTVSTLKIENDTITSNSTRILTVNKNLSADHLKLKHELQRLQEELNAEGLRYRELELESNKLAKELDEQRSVTNDTKRDLDKSTDALKSLEEEVMGLKQQLANVSDTPRNATQTRYKGEQSDLLAGRTAELEEELLKERSAADQLKRDKEKLDAEKEELMRELVSERATTSGKKTNSLSLSLAS